MKKIEAQPNGIISRPFHFRMDTKEADAICGLVGTDGLERILAISRLLDAENYYRQHPYILACHLLDLGIKTAEKNLREVVTPQVMEKKPE